MAGHLRSVADSIFIHCSSTHLQCWSRNGLLRMQNFPFIFKILYPSVVVGGGLIYSGDGKEPGRRLGEIRKGCAAKLTGACQKLQLIIETVADAAILAGVSATREEYDC